MHQACRITIVILAAVAPLLASDEAKQQEPPEPRIFYVRQSAGDDANDGLSPETAWRSLSMLEEAVHAGDIAYVGPGLYREMLTVANTGTADRRITFIADTTGAHTTDPPGTVMITGADPVEETIFVPGPAPGVFEAPMPDGAVLGVVEMDGPQYRYENAWEEARSMGGVPELHAVAELRSSFFFDRETEVVYVHTSDGKPPSTHEIELIRRRDGIAMHGKCYVTVIGFTFRHMATAGINFDSGSSHGVAIDNTAYGSWQGVRVINESTDVLVASNTLFRNQNSGIYFANKSTRGYAVGNVAYENAKGVRWSSASEDGLAVDNVAFTNREWGIAIEHTDGIRLSGNTLVDNAITQLRSRLSRYVSDGNCFQIGDPEQSIADIDFFTRYESLEEYQQAVRQDPTSREGCGPLPKRVDVHRLHAETAVYALGPYLRFLLP